MVALASAIARPSLLTWPLLERVSPLPLAPGSKQSAVSPYPERWQLSPSDNTQLPQPLRATARQVLPGRQAPGLVTAQVPEAAVPIGCP